MVRRQKPSIDKVLVVEGENDAHIFWNLLDLHGLTKEVRERSGFVIEPAGGYTEIQRGLRGEMSDNPTERALALSLSIRIKNGDVKSLGVVVDADTKLSSRWKSIRDVVIGTGYPPDSLPLDAVNGGFLLIDAPNDLPRLGIWIMPDNEATGMIEDFAQRLRPETEQQNKLWIRAELVVNQIPDDERCFPSDHTTKATIHTWLAWQKQPGKPIGQAIKAGYLSHKAESAQNLITWFQGLFALEIDA